MPARSGRRGRCATRRRAGDRRSRAGVALAEGPRDCHHRDEGQVDDDDADRAHAAGGGTRRAPPAAISAPRCRRRSRRRIRTPCTSWRSAAFSSKRPTRFIPWIAGAAESLAGSPRSPRHVRALRGRQGPHLRQSDGGRLGRGQRGRSRVDGARRRLSRAPARLCARRDRCRDGVTVEAGSIVRRHEPAESAPLVPLSSVRLPGKHLLGDVLAAAAVGCVAGVPPAAMQRAVEGFRVCRTRSSAWPTIDGVTFVNDSKATNIASARRVARKFSGRRRRDHGRPLQGRRLRRPARRRPRSCRGDRRDWRGGAADRSALSDAAAGDARRRRWTKRWRRRSRWRPGRASCVLAPACSSFDMFKDYADRGEQFRKAATELTGQRSQGKGQRQGARGKGKGRKSAGRSAKGERSTVIRSERR